MCNRDSPFCTFLGATTRERQRQGACPEQGGERFWAQAHAVAVPVDDGDDGRVDGVVDGEPRPLVGDFALPGEAGFERRPRRGTAPVTLVTWLPASSGALQKPA